MGSRCLALIVFVTACGGTDPSDDTIVYNCGGPHGQPGDRGPEGGEVRHEHVRFLGMPEQTWIQVYQYTGPILAAPMPEPDPNGTFGTCVDERQSATWPFTPIVGATYRQLPHVRITGPNIENPGLEVVETTPPNTTGNLTFRHYDFTYGGGAPSDPQSFNASTTVAMSQPGGDYTLDIGDGEPMTYHMPDVYDAPLDIGKVESVAIAAGRDLELAWTAPPNDYGASGHSYTKQTYFNYTLFIDPNNTFNSPQFICYPDAEGHVRIPQSVIDLLPATGVVVHADMTMYMDMRDGRRFDLVAIYDNVSLFTKQ